MLLKALGIAILKYLLLLLWNDSILNGKNASWQNVCHQLDD
jgi:hypothetical protein